MTRIIQVVQSICNALSREKKRQQSPAPCLSITTREPNKAPIYVHTSQASFLTFFLFLLAARKAAEHEARLLACAVPALRLLRHCLGRLSDAGAKPPVGPLDAVGALLDFEVFIALILLT